MWAPNVLHWASGWNAFHVKVVLCADVKQHVEEDVVERKMDMPVRSGNW